MSHPDNRSPIASKGFYLAAFGIDGILEGEGEWRHQDLSPKWLSLCDKIIAEFGLNFDHIWDDPLSEIRTKMSYANGASICTFFVNDRVALSALLLRGSCLKSDLQVSVMFVESLRDIPLVKIASVGQKPFEDVLAINARPLMIVVPMPDPSISDQNFELVRELSLHLASSFMRFES